MSQISTGNLVKNIFGCIGSLMSGILGSFRATLRFLVVLSGPLRIDGGAIAGVMIAAQSHFAIIRDADARVLCCGSKLIAVAECEFT